MATSIANVSRQAIAGVPPAAPPAPAQFATKEAFLQLLITQIKHQDPLNPADGVQFLTELTQFSSLEQMLAMRQELEAIRKAMVQAAPAASSE